MSSSRSRTGEDFSIVAGIIAGRPWIASSVKNRHLRHHGRALGRTFRANRSLEDPLRGSCRRLFGALARQSGLLDGAHAFERDLVPMLVRVAAYADRWLRPPETWICPPRSMPEARWSDLLRHLFTAWPLPAFFDSAWRERGDLIYLERNWFCDLGRGGSWRKTEGLPPTITGRALHAAWHSPAGLSVRQALRFGQLVALDAPEALRTEVLASGMVRDLSNDAVWSRLFEKVAAAQAFDPQEFGLIADVMSECLDQQRYHRALQLVELPLAELRQHCIRHWKTLLDQALNDGVRFQNRDLTRPGLRAELNHLTHAAWAPMARLSNFEVERAEGNARPSRWVIRERLSHAQLMAEGRELRHCVAGYWRRCQEGRSAIFSLRQFHPAEMSAAIIPRLTIEVDRASRRVVQARGKWNRWPDETEYRVLEDWAGLNELKLVV